MRLLNQRLVMLLATKDVIKDLATYLQTQGYGIKGKNSTGVSIYTSVEGGTTNSISIAPYGGSNSYDIKTGEKNASNPNIQITCRNLNEEIAISQSSDIHELLREKYNWDLGTTHFIYLRAKAPPIPLGKNQAGFYEYSVNFSTSIY
ncbi:MAG: minor capsid protein [Prevotella sp.]